MDKLNNKTICVNISSAPSTIINKIIKYIFLLTEFVYSNSKYKMLSYNVFYIYFKSNLKLNLNITEDDYNLRKILIIYKPALYISYIEDIIT